MATFWKKSKSDLPQVTIEKQVEISGRAFRWFSGESTVRFIPTENEGVVFRYQSQEIPALSKNVIFDEKHCTTLRNQGTEIRETEHILSAVYGLGITNLIIELDGVSELPILDGSSKPFVMLLIQVGLRRLPAKRHEIIISMPYQFIISGSDSVIDVSPANSFLIEMSVAFPEPIGKQNLSVDVSSKTYETEISFARAPLRCPMEDTTPALLREWFVGYEGNENVIIRYSKERYLSPLRSDDEVVRHKILDFIGDLANIGLPIRGKFRCHKVGHKINGEFVKLFSW